MGRVTSSVWPSCAWPKRRSSTLKRSGGKVDGSLTSTMVAAAGAAVASGARAASACALTDCAARCSFANRPCTPSANCEGRFTVPSMPTPSRRISEALPARRNNRWVSGKPRSINCNCAARTSISLSSDPPSPCVENAIQPVLSSTVTLPRTDSPRAGIAAGSPPPNCTLPVKGLPSRIMPRRRMVSPSRSCSVPSSNGRLVCSSSRHVRSAALSSGAGKAIATP